MKFTAAACTLYAPYISVLTVPPSTFTVISPSTVTFAAPDSFEPAPYREPTVPLLRTIDISPVYALSPSV